MTRSLLRHHCWLSLIPLPPSISGSLWECKKHGEKSHHQSYLQDYRKEKEKIFFVTVYMSPKPWQLRKTAFIAIKYTFLVRSSSPPRSWNTFHIFVVKYKQQIQRRSTIHNIIEGYVRFQLLGHVFCIHTVFHLILVTAHYTQLWSPLYRWKNWGIEK